MRCPTTSGPFRCDKDAGHVSECECTAPAAATDRRSLRVRLDIAQDAGLSLIGSKLGVERLRGEPDPAYRERIWRARP